MKYFLLFSRVYTSSLTGIPLGEGITLSPTGISVEFFIKIPPLNKNSPLVNDKISDEKKLKISNVLKRPKMRFSAPKAPKIFRDPEINKNSPLVNDNLSTRGGIFIKNSTDAFLVKQYFFRSLLPTYICFLSRAMIFSILCRFVKVINNYCSTQKAHVVICR